MPITPRTLRLAQRLRNDIVRIVDAHERELTKAWVDAWDEVAGQLEAALNELLLAANSGVLSTATILRSQRLQVALDVIARALTRLTDGAATRVTSDLQQVVREAGEAQRDIIGAQLPKSERDSLADWVRVDARQVQAIVQRTSERITSQMWPISAEADAAIRRELVTGIVTGRGPRQTGAAIVKRAENQFNGGLGRAVTIARTETLDAHRQAAQIAQEQNADVLDGWMWLAALKSNPFPCPACIGMNGTRHPLTEPGPLGHQNCRCTRVPVTKSWADLGIDLPEPEPVGADSQGWFDSLSVDAQRRILGPARHAAYQRGDFPLSKWATRRSNDGWRDSYVPAPAPKAA
ncbi:MAG TPA: phage minor head protein [Kribbella sp.]